MKKALALLLALVVLLTLCACGSDDSSQAEVELPKNGKKGPSQDLILQDLESALFQLPNAEVTEVTTVNAQPCIPVHCGVKKERNFRSFFMLCFRHCPFRISISSFSRLSIPRSGNQ